MLNGRQGNHARGAAAALAPQPVGNGSPGAEDIALITFAIPFYKGLTLLREAIESVRAQSVPDWRLIVCDEGVEPGAAAFLDDPRMVHSVNPTPLGMAGNWNRCLELACTELVTLLHADDRLLPGYAELMLEAARRHPGAAAFHCDARIIDGRGLPAFSFPDWVKTVIRPAGLELTGEEGVAALLRGNFIMCPTLCYVRPTREFSARWKMVQDLEYTLGLLLDGQTIVGLCEEGYEYRRHAGNATVDYTRSRLRFEEEFRLYDDVAALCAARGWRRAARTGRAKVMLRLHLIYAALGDLLGLRPGAALAKARLAVTS